MLGHFSLESYYKTLFDLVQHHKYSLAELEDMIPYELEYYIIMLTNYLKAEEKRMKDLNRKKRL
jgi:hypothetical protein